MFNSDAETEVENLKKEIFTVQNLFVKQKLLEELKSFEDCYSEDIKQYIKTVLSLPWNSMILEPLDIKEVERKLNKEIYGMQEMKDAFIETLSVSILNPFFKTNRNFLLHGGAGLGKSTICYALAKASNKKIVKLSMSGIDEVMFLKGTLRSYRKSKEGAIISAIRDLNIDNREKKKYGNENLIILLDEVEKASSTVQNLLLDILDKNQQESFCDDYIEIPYSLYGITFIATANDISKLSLPLLSRFEKFEVKPPTILEKIEIADKYIIPKQVEAFNNPKAKITFSDEAVRLIATDYSNAIGIREMETTVTKVIRKASREILEKNVSKYHVTDNEIRQFLSEKNIQTISIEEVLKNFEDKKMKKQGKKIGKVNSLGYVDAGKMGAVASLHVLLSPSQTENVRFQGTNYDDMFKASAEIVVTHIKSHSMRYGINPYLFIKKDINICFSDYATYMKKSGSSATLAIAIALLSVLTKIPLDSSLAVTGELQVDGSVSGVGGIVEKVIGAVNQGIDKIILSEENRKDVENLPQEIKELIEIKYYNHLYEIYKDIFKEENEKNNKKEKLIG